MIRNAYSVFFSNLHEAFMHETNEVTCGPTKSFPVIFFAKLHVNLCKFPLLISWKLEASCRFERKGIEHLLLFTCCWRSEQNPLQFWILSIIIHHYRPSSMSFNKNVPLKPSIGGGVSKMEAAGVRWSKSNLLRNPHCLHGMKRVSYYSHTYANGLFYTTTTVISFASYAILLPESTFFHNVRTIPGQTNPANGLEQILLRNKSFSLQTVSIQN